MRYQCLACNEEVERGWLPSATCGVYLFGLLGFSLSVLSLLLMPTLARHGVFPPRGQEPASLSWWVEPLILAGGLFAAIILTGWLDITLSLVEYFILRRKPCPRCG